MKVSEAARTLSQRGAAKGGKARAAALSKEQRSDIARRAAATRWAGRKSVKATKKPKALPHTVQSVVTDLRDLKHHLDMLRTKMDEKVLGAELAKMWRAALYGEDNEYTDDFGVLRFSSVFKAIADEYNLPGEFK